MGLVVLMMVKSACDVSESFHHAKQSKQM